MLRPATVYGPRSKEVVGEIARAMRNGNMLLIDRGRAVAGLCYVDNLVDAALIALKHEAAAGQEREQSTTFLKKARETVELFKAAELRDYFRDDCVDAARARTRALEDVSQTAAIVYPILLPARTTPHGVPNPGPGRRRQARPRPPRPGGPTIPAIPGATPTGPGCRP